jgi:hypothetical protein
MNKILILSSFLVLLFACKSTSPTTNQTSGSDRSSQSGLKGNWQITTVSYPGSEYLKVNSFQIADSKCFIGSTWNFIPNNNKGSMNLNSAGCPSFSSPIVWSISKDGSFVLKFVEAGIKSKKVIQGYLLRIANRSDSSFQLIDVINVAGQQKNIVYQFEKIN